MENELLQNFGRRGRLLNSRSILGLPGTSAGCGACGRIDFSNVSHYNRASVAGVTALLSKPLALCPDPACRKDTIVKIAGTGQGSYSDFTALPAPIQAVRRLTWFGKAKG
jgi:hypothetical protein